MKLKIPGLQISILFLITFFACSALFSLEIEGQTPRRTKSGKLRPKVQTALPVNAEIVSRDADYSSQNQIIEPATENSQTNAPQDNSQDAESTITELKRKIQTLEAQLKNNSDDKQKRLLMNLDILTRSEQRAETLRKQLFEMIEKESQIKIRLDQISNDIRPEVIERQVAFAGSLRPEDLRENRRKTLDIDKRNLTSLLSDIQTVRSNLEINVQKADLLVQKLRDRVEKEIDAALIDEPNY